MKAFISMGRIAALLFFSFAAAAQSEVDSVSAELGKELNKIFNSKVYMDVDTTVFPIKQGTFYVSEENAMIMTIVAPQSFAKAEVDFNKESDKEGFEVLEKKKFEHNGKKILYLKGTMKKDDKEGFMYLYAIEATAESTIFLTGVHMAGGEKKFGPAIERAALSARLTE